MTDRRAKVRMDNMPVTLQLQDDTGKVVRTTVVVRICVRESTTECGAWDQMRKLPLILAAACISHAAHAADFQLRLKPEPSITIEGILKAGDEVAFSHLPYIKGMTVHLVSPGGNLAAGIAIGMLIRKVGASTLVPAGESCASACADAWMGGVHRLLGEGARVGWHSTQCAVPTAPTCTDAATALYNAGQQAYWEQMGMPHDLAVRSTAEPPEKVRWLSKQHGVISEVEE